MPGEGDRGDLNTVAVAVAVEQLSVGRQGGDEKADLVHILICTREVDCVECVFVERDGCCGCRCRRLVGVRQELAEEDIEFVVDIVAGQIVRLRCKCHAKIARGADGGSAFIAVIVTRLSVDVADQAYVTVVAVEQVCLEYTVGVLIPRVAVAFGVACKVKEPSVHRNPRVQCVVAAGQFDNFGQVAAGRFDNFGQCVIGEVVNKHGV